ncbi:MAG: carbon-nitrogen hydrolase family protein [Nocardioidaceae bacterium]
MPPPLPIALVQTPAHPADDFEGFLDSVRAVVRRRPSVRLVVYPELHLCGPNDGAATAAPEALAQPLAGERDTALAAVAAELGVWLVPGSVYERRPDGHIHNTATLYSPTSGRVAAYRKIFPWRPYETCTPGGEFVVADLGEYGRVGLSICYDAWFPEVARHLAWLGADLIVNVVQTATIDRDQELVLTRATAITNQVFIASVNAATPTGLGRSLLVDPEGRVRVEAAGGEPCVLTDVIDLGEAERVRTYGTAGLNRPWSQFGTGDVALDLPLYSGKIDPSSWGAGLGAPHQAER